MRDMNTSRCKLLETIKNNINHSNLEKLSFGDKFIWLLNSESKDTLICMCDFLLKGNWKFTGYFFQRKTVKRINSAMTNDGFMP
jgi:hypothetical protein